MAESFGFTKRSAERIARAVKWAEQEARRNKPNPGQPHDRPWLMLGKANAAATAPDDLTVSVYANTGSSGTVPTSETDITDTGTDIDAYTLFGDIDSGAWVACAFVGGFWLVIAAECPA